MAVLISSLEGNRQKLDGGAMFGNAPRPLWQKWLEPDSLGRIDLACRSLLVEADNLKILFETGVGGYFEPSMAERYGVQDGETHKLLKALEARGIAETDIDYVVLSHLHFDHAGGLFPRFKERENGAQHLLFPNATYIVSMPALARNQTPHLRDRASFIPELPELLKQSNRLFLVDEKKPTVPKALEGLLSFVFSDGHTPGQMHSVITGENGTIAFCGDLIPGLPWLHIPITMGYDRFPELLIDEKSEFLQRAESEEWLLFFTHDPEVVAAKCEKNSKGRYLPNKPLAVLDKHQL